MKQITYDYTGVLKFATREELAAEHQKALVALKQLLEGDCQGNDFLGWINLPASVVSETERIAKTAERLRAITDTVVVIGIGGSYLGAKAVIEALSNPFEPGRVIFAGHQISEDYMADLQAYLKDKNFGICVISKSGTTTEPAIAFRLLKAQLEAQMGKAEARERIIAITDEKRGALRTLADKEGYETFVIPDNVGGRFSVLTPVGLVPIALAGFDINALVKGAVEMRTHLLAHNGAQALEYATVRNVLLRKGFKVEITVNYNPRLHYVAEWWKQLYGESEGKEGKGIFPAAVDFSTDLHSLGQYIQEGQRFLMESVLSVNTAKGNVVIPSDEDDLDHLNYLAGRRMDTVNHSAEEATRTAHIAGGVPNDRFLLPDLSEETLGGLFYLYELACGISGILLGVNPFNQPGVEAYKKEMFRLLGKPGC